MYKLIYNYKETTDNKVLEREYYFGEIFRTRKSAVHYLLDKIQSKFVGYGYRTQQMSSETIHCYMSELTTKNELKVIEWTITVKKS